MKKIKKVLTVLVLLSFSILSGNCQQLQVPIEYTTIQSAIDAAQKGDTILVDTGRYYENINFKGKSIVVTSKYILTNDTSFIANTIIDGSQPLNPDSASCVMIISEEDSNTVIMGFTLTNGTGTLVEIYREGGGGPTYIEGGGIITYKSYPTIRNNIIINNSVPDGGGGIATWYGDCKILNNIIVNNTAEYAAGLVLNWGDGVIRNNIIYHNNKIGSKWLTGGLMVWDVPGTAIIENNTIIGNTSSNTAGGVSITTSDVIFTNNIVWGNRQKTGQQITGAESDMVQFCNLENPIANEGNISSFPFFQDASFNLATGSPCIDAGNDSVVYNDNENSLLPDQALTPSLGSVRNDMGAFGGPGAAVLNKIIHVEDIYVLPTINFGKQNIGDSINKKFEVLNLGTSVLSIDSITLQNNIVSIEIGKDLRTIESLRNDTVLINWKPATIGKFVDTLKIYHSLKNIENPKKVIISGEAISTVTHIITFNALDSKTLDDSPFELTATSNCGLSVSYTSSDETVATISGTTVTILGTGTTRITASQTGNEIYNAATPVEQTLEVIAPTAVQVISQATVSFYPNPAYDHITIQSDEIIDWVEIWNINGTLISLHRNCLDLDIGYLKAGIYLLKVGTTDGVSISKLIKR